MKTANLPFRPAIVLGLIAGLTVAAGLLPVSSTAQESNRTIATGSNIPLTADAPDQYTVKTGDTLWDISTVFLRDPWYWPEIWYVNPQVKNPHLIYPGDVLVLVKGGARPQVTIAERGPEGAAADAAETSGAPLGGGPSSKLTPRIRSTQLTDAVTTIPYDSIAAFLGRPTVISATELKTGPYVVAL